MRSGGYGGRRIGVLSLQWMPGGARFGLDVQRRLSGFVSKAELAEGSVELGVESQYAHAARERAWSTLLRLTAGHVPTAEALPGLPAPRATLTRVCQASACT